MLLNPTLTVPKTKIEVPTKSYVDKKFNDPNIMKNTANVDFNDKNLEKVKFKKRNSIPAVGGHLAGNYYVDKAIF